MYTFLNDISTTRLQMSAELTAEMQDLLEKYKCIEGDYEETLIKGVWHYMCDSGINTDAFSVEDAEAVERDFAHLKELNEDGDEEETDEWYEAVDAAELQCNAVLAKLSALEKTHGVEADDLARELMFMEENIA